MTKCARPAAAMAALLLSATAVRAQTADVLHFSAGAGVAFPSRGGDDDLRTGYHLQAALDAYIPGAPLTLRLETFADRFGSGAVLYLPCAPQATCLSRPLHEQRLGATLDLVLGRKPGARVLPYFIAGGGVYKHEMKTEQGGGMRWGTGLGANAGAGLRLPAHLFLEARAHVVSGAADVVPITAGFRF